MRERERERKTEKKSFVKSPALLLSAFTLDLESLKKNHGKGIDNFLTHFGFNLWRFLLFSSGI